MTDIVQIQHATFLTLGTQYAYLAAAGLLVSLSGSLPLGALNVTAMQIAAKESVRSAMLFAIGVTAVEMGYLIFTISIIGQLANQPRFFIVCSAISVILLVIMAAGSFISVRSKQNKNIIIDNSMNRLLLGVCMSAVNPMQIPFWMGWTIYLLSRSLPLNVSSGNIIFTLSAGLGTFVALVLFIILGKRLSELLQRKRKVISVLMGCLFTALAVIQVVKFL